MSLFKTLFNDNETLEEHHKKHFEEMRQINIVVNHDIQEWKKHRAKVNRGLSKIGLTAKDIELLIELKNR